jgi:hypothetical protein
MQAGYVEGHGRLDVVPRVAVASGEPGDHPGGQLQLGDAAGRGQQLARREQAREVGEVVAVQGVLRSGFVA